MEFKRKLKKRRKVDKQARKKATGCVRVTIRGRKRWVRKKSRTDATA